MSDEPLRVTVRPYHWEVDDKAIDGVYHIIRVWCLDQSNTPYLLRIENYPYSCMIQLPVAADRRRIAWDVPKARKVYASIVQTLYNKDHVYPFCTSSFVYKKLFYDLQIAETTVGVAEDLKNGKVGTFPMLCMFFKNRNSMHEVANKLRVNAIKVHGIGTLVMSVWETDIDIVTKLLAFTGIRRCSWVYASGVHVPKETSTLYSEFIVDWRSIRKVPDELCREWKTTPGILSWDLECYSPNHNKFPEKWDVECVQYMVTCNYKRGNGTTHVRLIIMGDCNDIELEGMSVKVIRVNDIQEMADAFAAVLAEFDPEIITGFRIQSFDYEYFDAKLAIDICNWPVCGRLKGERAYIKDANKQSGAYGFNKMYYFHSPGRITMDCYQYFRREYKYPEYNLNYISSKLLKDKKHDISAPEMFTIYEMMAEGLRRGKGTPEYTKGMEEMTRVARYCIQDAQLVLRLFDHVNLWVSTVEMANIMCVNIYSIYTSGQQVRCLNQLALLAFEKCVVLNTRETDEGGFKGGQVQEPKTGLHECVQTIDFNSLYPSIIIENNVCYTTHIPETLWKYIPITMCNVVTVEQASEKKSDSSSSEDSGDNRQEEEAAVTGSITIRFIKREYVKGLLPKLVGRLIAERRSIQEELKKGYDIVLDKRQLAVKVSANSFFGFTGTGKNGIRPYSRVAMAITAYGRIYITRVNNYIYSRGGDVIYGDTDSSMVTDPSADTPAKCKVCIEEICDGINALFPGGVIKMKPEHYCRLLSVKKKKYAMCKYGSDGDIKRNSDGSPEMDVKGLMSVRREFCDWARQTFDRVLGEIMDRKSLRGIINYLIDRIAMMMSGGVSHKDLLLNGSISAAYENDSYPMKLFSDKLRNIGKKIDPGERLYFLVREAEIGERLLGERYELEETYLESLTTENPMRLDYAYYIDKVLRTHIDDLISISYPVELEYLRGFTYRKGNSYPLRLNQPVAFITTLIQEEGSAETFRRDFNAAMDSFVKERVVMPVWR